MCSNSEHTNRDIHPCATFGKPRHFHENTMKPLSAVATVFIATVLCAPAQADTSPDLKASLFGALIGAVVNANAPQGAQNDQPAATNQPARRMGNPAVFANTGVSGAFEKELRAYPDKPEYVAQHVCSTYAGQDACLEFLRPRVEAEAVKVRERQAQAKELAAQREAAEEEAKRQKIANPQKAAADLAQAEARMAELVGSMVKLRPNLKGPMREDDAAWRERTKGLCREMVGNATPGSMEARIAITDCWTAYANMRIDWIEKAVRGMQADEQNVPLRPRSQ